MDEEYIDEEYMRKVMKNIQMLATLVATAAYAAAFNPPGGVWQDIHDATGQHLPGDPIMRSTHHGRYVVFFYCNAAAFAFSLAVVVLTLLVTPLLKPKTCSRLTKRHVQFLVILMSLMLVAMLALAAAYGAGACQDKVMVAWYCVLVPGPLALFILHIIALVISLRAFDSKEKISLGGSSGGSSTGDDVQQAAVVDKEKDGALIEEKEKKQDEAGKDFRKLMVPVSMFALTITYVAGLSTPGGFWDTAEGGHRPGDAILRDRLHGKTLRGFLVCNTLAFAASLYSVSIVLVMKKKKKKKTSFAGFLVRFNTVVVVLGLLVGLLVAYISASSRGRRSTAWLSEAALAYSVIHVAAYLFAMKAIQSFKKTGIWYAAQTRWEAVADALPNLKKLLLRSSRGEPRSRQAKLVQLMAGLAVAITYQAGLYPPGGLWPANADGHMAGDPILLTTNAKRYKGFYYCNSVSFVASLLAMFLAQKSELHDHHALEAAMILDMLGLVGAYAIGSCRDQVSTLYVAGLAGAAVVYVFVHVSYFTLDEGNKKQEDSKLVEKKGGRFLLFAILVASITYQAGLTPPGGFLLKDDAQSGHHAGDPVLRYNYPRRYRTFIYCNSVSFMLSIVLILLLINPIEYGPAIQSHALSVSSAVSYICLMGAFAAGSTQHMKGSIYIFVLAGLAALTFCLVMPLWKYLQKEEGASENNNTRKKKEEEEKKKKEEEEEEEEKEADDDKKKKSKRLYLVTLGILVASATYPTGLDPPGGSWQSSSDGHDAGNPMMYDNRRPRYLAFFFGNTTAFMASIMLIHMLLPDMLLLNRTMEFHELYGTGSKGLVSLQCLGFLVAYAAGSSRHWKTSLYIGALVGAVLLFVVIHVTLSVWLKKPRQEEENQLGQASDHGGQIAP